MTPSAAVRSFLAYLLEQGACIADQGADGKVWPLEIEQVRKMVEDWSKQQPGEQDDRS